MASARDLSRLGRAVAEMEDEALAARGQPQPERRLAAIRAKAALRERASLRRPIAIGAGLGAVAAAALLWSWPEPLRFTVGDRAAPGAVGVWVAAAEARTPVAFSDGSRVLLDAGARARVVSVGEHGAHIVLERGALSADVVPRRGNDWSLIGGPFEVHVTGTSFDASWDPTREELVVTMREGHVIIRGACLDRERSLSRGEAARLSCRGPSIPPRPSVDGGATDPPAPLVAPDASATVAVDAKLLHPVDPPRGPSVDAEVLDAGPPSPTFRELGRRGEYKQALGAAEALGFETLCDTLPASDLLELGTTARLAKRGDRAALAYAAIRRRFPGGDAAATAAFLLGQMAFDGARAFTEAHRWFEVYLAERPSGALAEEALGRLMEAERRMGDLAAARVSAARYLARSPDGAHAALARSLLAP